LLLDLVFLGLNCFPESYEISSSSGILVDLETPKVSDFLFTSTSIFGESALITSALEDLLLLGELLPTIAFCFSLSEDIVISGFLLRFPFVYSEKI